MDRVWYGTYLHPLRSRLLTLLHVALVSSRQTFAFARDGALPFSSILYRMNKTTGTPLIPYGPPRWLHFFSACWRSRVLKRSTLFRAFRHRHIHRVRNAHCARWIWRKKTVSRWSVLARSLRAFYHRKTNALIIVRSDRVSPCPHLCALSAIHEHCVHVSDNTLDQRCGNELYIRLLGGTLILAVGWYYFPYTEGTLVHRPVRTTEDFQAQNTSVDQVGKTSVQ